MVRATNGAVSPVSGRRLQLVMTTGRRLSATALTQSRATCSVGCGDTSDDSARGCGPALRGAAVDAELRQIELGLRIPESDSSLRNVVRLSRVVLQDTQYWP